MEKALKNLKKLAKQLPILANTTHPHIKTDFNMKMFCNPTEIITKLTKENIHLCGTHGCLLGNAPHVLKPKKQHFLEDGGFDYQTYCKDVFPHLSANMWSFLFSSEWVNFQPTFDQSIQRLNYAIKHKLDFYWQYQTTPFI